MYNTNVLEVKGVKEAIPTRFADPTRRVFLGKGAAGRVGGGGFARLDPQRPPSFGVRGVNCSFILLYPTMPIRGYSRP